MKFDRKIELESRDGLIITNTYLKVVVFTFFIFFVISGVYSLVIGFKHSWDLAGDFFMESMYYDIFLIGVMLPFFGPLVFVLVLGWFWGLQNAFPTLFNINVVYTQFLIWLSIALMIISLFYSVFVTYKKVKI